MGTKEGWKCNLVFDSSGLITVVLYRFHIALVSSLIEVGDGSTT